MKIKKRTLKLTAAISAVVIAVLFMIEATPLGHDRIEFDLTTGRTRYVFKVVGIPWRTTPAYKHQDRALWFARELQAGETEQWIHLGNLNPGSPSYHNNAGFLWYDINNVDRHLQSADTDEPGRELMGQFFLTRIRSLQGGYEGDRRDWFEMEHVFNQLSAEGGSYPLASSNDVQRLIDEAKQSVSR